ncbi:dnaJ homolog dnj-5 isoform X2 [Toxorhynchites rutilus septentrionalis]|uniref:dnaJ homolog dnj-5 isoform X2 n=1 Tax=Toxorhynchites rutilus septentrionalis TaxID=329112 RepID=UPI0024799413|nr:dnaJ homolog dnj-5 isoform X2 [Toxorhynchites rutilus septentrionalis]
MSGNGNEQNEGFWTPEQSHPAAQQPQYIAPDGPVPGTSNSYFHPNTGSDAPPTHGLNYGHPPLGDNFTVLRDGYGNFIKVYHQPNEDLNLNNPVGKYEYELFSGTNNFMHPAPGFGLLFHQQQPQPDASASAPKVQQSGPVGNDGSNTNMLINQLVGNWAPTISGTYSPFGGVGPSLLAEGLPRSSDIYVQPQQPPQQQQQPHPHQPQQQKSPIHQPLAPSMNNSPPAAVHLPHSQPQQQSTSPTASGAVSSSATSYNQLNDDNSAKLNQNVKKQRIVAEVKPMRMSYSDVLSKNVAPSGLSTPPPTQSNGGSGNSAAATITTTKLNTAPSSSSTGATSSGGGKQSKAEKGHTKKSSQQQQQLGGSEVGRRTERAAAGSGQKKGTPLNSSNPAAHQANGEIMSGSKQNGNGSDRVAKKLDKSKAKLSKDRFLSEGGGSASGGKRNRSRNLIDAYSVEDLQGPSGSEGHQEEMEELEEDDDEEEEEDDAEEEEEEYEKIIVSRSSYKRGNRTAGANRSKADKSYQQANGKRGLRPKKNQKYVMIQKVVNAWIEYTVIALMWLWSLVSDVVYLSLRLVWDYLVAAYQYSEQHLGNVKRELQQNRPGTWLKGIWKSFDSRFAKDSKWAFWRGKKKTVPTEEQATSGANYYKDGRLPSTADEAMSSLLNCKGKDAYSILGVRLDCSQEQIRKHYKKIAVLVHPDKNKQPGAEEAFKVLQRSFELIGEPENRKAYDQSLAEALNAEKAWSEINDLLTQLHTKISEAANTIRCSSCCLRHPRKPTGRPQYAARECNSCKIRHSAREGDIWAETTFFGLRWKYLAMMEGNVYDITEWANCQKGALSHLQPNSHIVQYRIVLGGNSQQQQQQQQQQQGNQSQSEKDAARIRKDAPSSEPSLDDFLNNIYAGQNQQQHQQQQQQQSQSGSRRRHRRN